MNKLTENPKCQKYLITRLNRAVVCRNSGAGNIAVSLTFRATEKNVERDNLTRNAKARNPE